MNLLKRCVAPALTCISLCLFPSVARATLRCEGLLLQSEIASRQAVTLALLKEKKYDQLQRRMDGFLADYTKGKITDEQLFYEFGAFDRWGPFLTPLFQEWLDGQPKSFAAHHGMALHLSAVAWRSRGNDLSRNTSSQQMNEFERGLRAARELSLKSISLHPKPILAYQQLVSGAKALRFDGNSWKRFLGMEVLPRGASNLEPRPDVLPYWRASIQVQPDNVIVREAYIDLLAPRWGGSVEALRHQAIPTTHPGLSADRQAHISYSATMTIAYDHWFRKDFDGAVALLQAASKHCRLEQPFVDIGLIRLEQQRYAEVLAAASTAAELLPSSTPAALLRAHALRGLGRHTEAAPILLSLAPEGIPEVAYFLGEYHANGQGGFSVNPIEARRFFEIAARGGDRRAIQQLQSLPAAK